MAILRPNAQAQTHRRTALLKTVALEIDEIYVPAERRKELDPQKVEELAGKIMEDAEGQQPIRVRQGKGRYVLIKGVHRLEARKALGDKTIHAVIVGSKQF